MSSNAPKQLAISASQLRSCAKSATYVKYAYGFVHSGPANHDPNLGAGSVNLLRRGASDEARRRPRNRRSTSLLILLAALPLAGCEQLFPPPLRPSTDGYRAWLRGKAGNRSVAFDVSFRRGLGRRDWGNDEVRRSVILRPDLGEAYELDERTKTARVRPLRPGESLYESWGPYPFEPVPLVKLDLTSYGKKFPDFEVTSRALSDAGVGMHPCDVLRLDRLKSDGSGVSETWYLARDLDGLVVHREVRTILENRWGPDVEWNELENVRIEAEEKLFEIPEGWQVVRERGARESPGK